MDVQAVPITGGRYCDQKPAIEHGEVEVDHHMLRSAPPTSDFSSMREVRSGVGEMLLLEVVRDRLGITQRIEEVLECRRCGQR